MMQGLLAVADLILLSAASYEVSHIQRSIPFPPIRLERLVKYLVEAAQRSPLPLEEARERGLDIGRGDITRFFKRLGLIEVVDGRITPTQAAYELLSLYNLLGNAVFHVVFYSALIQYKLLYDIVREKGEAGLDELRDELNRRMREISPSTWVNDVAFKSLVSFGVDVGAFKRRGRSLQYAGNPISKAIAAAFGGAAIGGSAYVPDIPEWLAHCARRVMPTGVMAVDESCAAKAVEDRLISLIKIRP